MHSSRAVYCAYVYNIWYARAPHFDEIDNTCRSTCQFRFNIVAIADILDLSITSCRRSDDALSLSLSIHICAFLSHRTRNFNVLHSSSICDYCALITHTHTHTHNHILIYQCKCNVLHHVCVYLCTISVYCHCIEVAYLILSQSLQKPPFGMHSQSKLESKLN